jgi:hypothetical protein
MQRSPLSVCLRRVTRPVPLYQARDGSMKSSFAPYNYSKNHSVMINIYNPLDDRAGGKSGDLDLEIR